MQTSILRMMATAWTFRRPVTSKCGRGSAVSDIGFLVGVDQTYYRHHAVNLNKRDFSSGTVHGQLIDLTQRWQSFGAQFAGVGGKAPRFYRSPAKPWRVKHWSVSTMPRQEAVGTFHQGGEHQQGERGLVWFRGRFIRYELSRGCKGNHSIYSDCSFPWVLTSIGRSAVHLSN